LVRGVLASRWVSGAYLPGDVRFSRRVARRLKGSRGPTVAFALRVTFGLRVTALTVAFAVCTARESAALAASGSPGESARTLIDELEKGGSARELVGPALGQAKEALAKAAAAPPTRAPLLEATALEWAEVARDLARASSAERASDRLEQDASATQTEIARVRAAVEQTMARVGRARQELKELEGGVPSAAAATAVPSGAAERPAPSGTPASRTPASLATKSRATKSRATKSPVAQTGTAAAAKAPSAKAPSIQAPVPSSSASDTPPAQGAPH
jgi:hypothetical protein